MNKPTIPPGLYRWPTGRVYSHTELKVIKHNGAWCVVPKVVK